MWWRWLWRHILERFWLWIWLWWRRMWYVSLCSFGFFCFWLTESQAVAVVVVVPWAFLAVDLAVEEAVVCPSIFVLSPLTHA
jgi:hypothetical protein